MSGNRLPVATSEKSTRPASKSSRLMLIASPSVIVHDLRIPRRSLAPFKAYPPLIVDADAVLSTPVAMQGFEPITRRHPQIVELFGRVNGKELGSCAALNLVRHGLDRITGKQRCRALVGEALDHGGVAYRKPVRSSRLTRHLHPLLRQRDLVFQEIG